MTVTNVHAREPSGSVRRTSALEPVKLTVILITPPLMETDSSSKESATTSLQGTSAMAKLPLLELNSWFKLNLLLVEDQE